MKSSKNKFHMSQNLTFWVCFQNVLISKFWKITNINTPVLNNKHQNHFFPCYNSKNGWSKKLKNDNNELETG